MTADPLGELVDLDGVASAYAAARDGIDALLRDRGLRRSGPETTAASLLRGAHASAVLEGSSATWSEVTQGGGDEIAASALRLSTELLGLVPVLRAAPAQALARLHTVAAAGVVPADRLGRPRDAASAERLHAVARLVLAPTTAPGLLVAAVVHADLVAAAPFASHNGLVARATERLLLVLRGVDPRSVIVPEAGHLELRTAYEATLRDYREDPRAGVRGWLLHAAAAYAAAAEASPLAPG